MARLTNIVSASRDSAPSIDVASAELGQLLYRLQQTVLHPTPERERRLRTSEYERARLESNLDYARTQLTKLEQEALSLKLPGRRLEVQGALNQRRETLELLLDRLEDFRNMATDDDDTSDEEDLLGDLTSTPSQSMDSTTEDIRQQLSRESEARSEPVTEPEHPLPSPSLQHERSATQPPTQTSQALRARPSAPSTSSSSSHTTARAVLFANRRKPSTPHSPTATAEAILDHQRAEQDMLSDSILKMAGALKESSQRFSSTLDADRDVVSRAGEGLDKTGRGMEAAKGRMGVLKRMTEGKGWWGRMILYAWIFGLMIALVLLVFVMPKLRF